MSILNRANIGGVIGAGSLILNDYALEIIPMDNGYRLTVTRGSEVQTMDLTDGVGIKSIEKVGGTGNVDKYRITLTDGNTFEYEIETNEADHALAEAGRANSENERVIAEEKRVAAESARESAEQNRISAEAGRVNAEYKREEAFAVYKGEIDQFKAEIVTSKDAATENTRFAIGEAEEGLEVPSMEEFNELKGDTLIERKSNQLYDNAKPNIFNGYVSGNTFVSSISHKILYIPCKPKTQYVVSRKSLVGNRFLVYTSDTEPSTSSVITSYETAECVTPTHGYIAITTDENAHFICVLYYNMNLDTEHTEDELRTYIKIEEGTVPSGGLSTIEYRKSENVLSESPALIERITVHLGDELFDPANVTLGNGWSHTDGVYTKTAGYDESMSVFGTDKLLLGSVYLVEFDTDYTAGEFLNVAVGTGYKILVYNGTGHIMLPLVAIGDRTIRFTPSSEGYNLNFSIWNISIRRIQPSGDVKEISTLSVNSDNHKQNFGFWNVMIGRNAENASGSTRTIAIGNYALRDLQGGHRNVAIGTFAMSQLLGGEANVSIGADTMLTTKEANNSVAVGCWALYNAQTVEESVAIGQYAMYKSQKSMFNVAVGQKSGFNLNENESDDAWYNAYLGYQAGYRNRGGSGNVSIGGMAYGGNGGNYNVNVGYSSSYEAGVENSIAIGANAKAEKSNQAVIGTSSITEVIIAGKKIIFNADGTVRWEEA